MFLLAVLVAAGLIYGLVKLGNPLKAPKPPPMPDPITHQNVEIALRHIAETYGHTEHDDAHDEADGPAPVPVPLPPTRRKRGRPRKPKPAPVAPATTVITTAPDAGVSKTQVGRPLPATLLAGGLRIPVVMIYAGGHHAGERRAAVILGVLGQNGTDGDFHVQCLRCICDKAKAFRTFRVDRISELADGATGEIVPDIPAWLSAKLAALV